MYSALSRRLLLLVTLVLVGSACASASGDAGDDDSDATPRDVITTAQLQRDGSISALQVIRKLKPTWLQRRGQQSLNSRTELLLVVDGAVSNDLGPLRSLRAADLREIRFMDAREATLRYGISASGGAILVYTR